MQSAGTSFDRGRTVVTLSIVDRVIDWTGKVISCLAIFAMAVICYEVIERYGFNAPTIWAHEATVYLCGAYYVLGGSYTLLHHAHVRVDVFYVHFPARVRALIDLVTFPLFLSFVGVILWTGIEYGFESLMVKETSGTAWSPPVYYVKLSIPVGAGLFLIQGVAQFVRDFIVLVGKKS
jgi:TRAP-type mannitol/chloroaromatic compound transport system permease small subunit